MKFITELRDNVGIMHYLEDNVYYNDVIAEDRRKTRLHEISDLVRARKELIRLTEIIDGLRAQVTKLQATIERVRGISRSYRNWGTDCHANSVADEIDEALSESEAE